jgi:pyrimidine-nucleoside phosphorylase
MAKKTDSLKEASDMLKKNIENGKGYEKLLELVKAQGGDESMVSNPDKLPKGKYEVEIKSEEEKYISRIDSMEVGNCSLLLGAGRETKDSKIDLGAGIYIHKKVSEIVKKGETIATIYANDIKKADEAVIRLKRAFSYSTSPVKKRRLIYGIVTNDGVEKY